MRLRRLGRCCVRVLALLCLVTGLGLLTQVSASADPPPGDWSRLRFCESSDDYSVAAWHGHYGAYQFDLNTWRSVGGSGYPHRASRSEQDYRALYLYRMRGWQPWECAGMVGLRNERDARSGVVPSRADSAYISGGSAGGSGGGSGGSGGGSGSVMPKWPGLVYAYGDCAPALRTFQLRMNHFGYDFQGTGCYYAKTKQAVLDLQRANGIRDSGRLGPKTWRAAWHGKAPR